MSVLAKLGRNAAWMLSASVLEKVVAFVFMPVIGKVLGVEQLGAYALAGAIIFVFTFLNDMGLAPVAIRELAREKRNASELLSTILTLRVCLALAYYPILLVFAWLSPYSPEVRHLLVLMGLGVIASAVSGSCESASIAFERMRPVAAARVVSSVAGCIAGLSALFLAHEHKLAALVGATVAVDAGIASTWVFFTRRRLQLHWRVAPAQWKGLILQALPFAGMMFLHQLNNTINAFLLSIVPGRIPPRMAIGYYAPASTLARLPIPLLSGLRQVLVPAVASGEHDRRTLAGVMEWSFTLVFWLMFVPLTVAGLCFPDLVIFTLFSKASFAASVPAFRVLSVAYGLEALMIVVTGYAAASREVYRVLPYALMAVVLNVAVAVALIGHFSFVGAAWGVLVAKAYALGAVILLCRRLFGADILPLRRYVGLVLTLPVVYGVGWGARLVAPNPWVALVLAGGLIGSFALWHLRRLRRSVLLHPAPTAGAAPAPAIAPTGLVERLRRKPLRDIARALIGRLRLLCGLKAPMRTPDRQVLENVIFPFFADGRAGRVLFVGTDWFTHHYPALFPRSDFWTIEVDARRSRFGAPQHVQDSLENLDRHFPAAHFDLIVCNGVFGWGLDDRNACERAFAQCHRALVPGGVLVLGWNDLPAHRPFPLEELESLSRFGRWVFPPLGVWRHPVGNASHHTYDFYITDSGQSRR